MRIKKNDEKGYFFRAGLCAALSSFYLIISGRKNAIFEGKGYIFYNFTKGCRSKRVCVLIYYIGKGYFLTGHSEKGYQFQNLGHTV